MKKLFSSLLAAVMAVSIPLSVSAQEAKQPLSAEPRTVITTEYLGNSITVETKTTTESVNKISNFKTVAAAAKTSSRSSTRSKTYKDNGKTIATVTLKATFQYNGSSAWVTKKSASHTTKSGWSYGSESLSASGDTAYLSAVLTQRAGGISTGTVDVDISLSCSPTGQIS